MRTFASDFPVLSSFHHNGVNADFEDNGEFGGIKQGVLRVSSEKELPEDSGHTHKTDIAGLAILHGYF